MASGKRHMCVRVEVLASGASGRVRMRQEAVRVASGRRQDNFASGWRQDDVKRRGARIKSGHPQGGW